jgi:hypothetical protein
MKYAKHAQVTLFSLVAFTATGFSWAPLVAPSPGPPAFWSDVLVDVSSEAERVYGEPFRGFGNHSTCIRDTRAVYRAEAMFAIIRNSNTLDGETEHPSVASLSANHPGSWNRILEAPPAAANTCDLFYSFAPGGSWGPWEVIGVNSGDTHSYGVSFRGDIGPITGEIEYCYNGSCQIVAFSGQPAV